MSPNPQPKEIEKISTKILNGTKISHLEGEMFRKINELVDAWNNKLNNK